MGGSLLTRWLDQLKACIAINLGKKLHTSVSRGLETLGLVEKLLERKLSALMLRALTVGMRHHAKSIGVALDME